MAKFNSIKKISTEDIPQEHRGWFGKVLEGLNPFIQQTVTTLSNGIVLGDNNRSVKITATIGVNQIYPMNFNLRDLKARPSMVLIGSLRTIDGTAISNPFSLTWTYDDGTLSYTLLGLSASSKYEISLIALL
jgi:hypothetical protein